MATTEPERTLSRRKPWTRGLWLSLVPVLMCTLSLAAAASRAPAREDALQGAERLLLEAQRVGNPERLAQAYAVRAAAHQGAGDRQRALADAQTASQLVPASAPAPLRAAIAGTLGQARLRAGEIDAAEAPLQEAIVLADSSGNTRIAAVAVNDLGLLYLRLQRLPDAALQFRRAQAAAANAGDTLTAASAAINLGRLELRSGNLAAATGAASSADKLLATAPASRDTVLARAAAGDLLRELGRTAGDPAVRAARLSLEGTAASAAELRDPYAVAFALIHLAELEIDQRNLPAATRLSARAQFAAQASGQPLAVFRAQWQSARLLDTAGDATGAINAYRASLASLNEIKPDIAADTWAAGDAYRERVGAAYLGFVELLLRRAGQDSDAQRSAASLREARAVIERFRTVELEDYFRDDCVERYLAGIRPLEQAAAGTAIIYPIPLRDRLELLVSVGERMYRVSVPVGEEQLRQETNALRAALERRTTFQYLPHARQLYDWVIRPLDTILTGASVHTLVMIPDAPLRGVPLAALHDGNDFLLARYAVAIAPSLTLVDPRPLASRGTSILAAGVSQAVQGFTALPAVEGELSEVAAFGAKSVLLDSAFSAQAFETNLRETRVSVVHVASHARFSADSRQSFLLTYDGRLSIDRLEQQLRTTRLRDEPIELLFLSACESAAGDERAALGLAGVAVKAGARSAVATLWQVSDAATRVLVGEFYRQLAQPGVSKAEALRRAQQLLLSDLRYRHPGLWSPFMVIGNWL
jgi:CHAT domain-containing protein